MQTKHFTVSTVLLVTVAITLQLVRGQDCDPLSGCNEQSFCVASGYCSCLSGFSGDSCLVQPQSSCISSYNDPSDTESSFDSLLEFSLTQDVLNIQINASLEKNRFVNSSDIPLVEGKWDSAYSLGTTITWAESSNCAYPSSTIWSKAAVVEGRCLDSYSFQLNISDAVSTCGFSYDSNTNTLSNDVTITRFYSLPPDMTIMDPSRRIEGRPRISIESKTFTITVSSGQKPNETPEPSDPIKDDSSLPSEEAEVAPLTSSTTSAQASDNGFFVKVIAAAAGVAGLCFIVVIIAVIVVRRRRSRREQEQFNFEGINSN